MKRELSQLWARYKNGMVTRNEAFSWPIERYEPDDYFLVLSLMPEEFFDEFCDYIKPGLDDNGMRTWFGSEAATASNDLCASFRHDFEQIWLWKFKRLDCMYEAVKQLDKTSSS